jgi:hypothetical protein
MRGRLRSGYSSFLRRQAGCIPKKAANREDWRPKVVASLGIEPMTQGFSVLILTYHSELRIVIQSSLFLSTPEEKDRK